MVLPKASSQRGMSLMEIIVASSILITVVVGAVGALQLYASIVARDVERTQAAILVQEAAEALQLMRDASWESEVASLALDTPYHLMWNGTSYAATTTEVVLHERFMRTVEFADVLRNENDTIAESGTVDADTRRVTITVYRAADDSELLMSDLFLHNIYETEEE